MEGSRISKKNIAIIAGHYIFSTDKFKKIKDSAQKKITNIDIDTYLKNEIKENILKYVTSFQSLSKKRI